MINRNVYLQPVKKFSTAFIVFLLFVAFAFAQSGKQILQGTIVDSETHLPIENADILDKNSGTGTTSDKAGKFLLWLKIPARLSVTHIGYATQVINLTDFPDSSITVYLKKTATPLPVVSIVPGKAENVIKNNNLSVMDYEFIDENILILAQSTRLTKPSLILLDQNFDTLTVTTLDVHPDFIFRDCMDNLHLVAKDFAFQLNFDGRKIQLLYPVTADKLKETLFSCVEKLHQNYYFNEYANKGLSLLYFFNDSAGKNNELLDVISDRKKLNMLESEAAFALAEGHSYEEWDKHFFDSIVVSKVYAPLVKLNDTIYVFDFVNGEITQYNENGKLLEKTQVSFHEQRNWKKNILTDEAENKCYAVFEKNGIISLKAIDIRTGEIESTTDFSGFAFAENIKVRGGYVYFLFPDPTRQGYVRLYRKRL